MKTIGKTIGPILWIGASLLMFAFWFSAMSHWFGFLGGAILAFVLSPGLLIFPIIFWIVEGVFPTLYFLVWGIGIAGLIIGSISSNKDSSLEETANPNITDTEQAEFDELFEDSKEVEKDLD